MMEPIVQDLYLPGFENRLELPLACFRETWTQWESIQDSSAKGTHTCKRTWPEETGHGTSLLQMPEPQDACYPLSPALSVG